MTLFVFYLVWENIKRRFLTSITISNSDPCYKWLLKYLIDNNYLNQKMSDCIVKKAKPKARFGQRRRQEKTQVEYFPAPGSHSF